MMEADQSALPLAEPFPEVVSASRESQSFLKSSSVVLEEEEEEEEDEESEAVEAAQVRKRRGPRYISVDEAPELRNSDLAQWTANYAANMAQASRLRRQHRLPFQAKRNAAAWVFGAGIGGVGIRLTNLNLPGPLDMFSGDALMEAVTGIKTRTLGRKRHHDEEEESASGGSGRRTRPRNEEKGIGRTGSLPLDDEVTQPLFGDDVCCSNGSASLAS